ncbi:hypothetical protein BDN70DRAFT_764562, partial [Pholiota conissans]
LLKKYAGYAILSHTWLRSSPGEITYDAWNSGIVDLDATGYQKLVKFCQTAWQQNKLCFGWMDKVCINKNSSSELGESIRSMYNWYQRASVCIVHLADTQGIEEIHRDAWFTRGWTLQELFAPDSVKFYNKDWKTFVVPRRGSNDDDRSTTLIGAQITKATTITRKEL